jgi:type IX secretion system PorP/SprF family membrane protein
MKKLSYIILVIFSVITARAQDYHLSHYDAMSLYYNPATTGMYNLEKGDYKIYFDQRSQWRAIGIKPFVTTFIGYDMPYEKDGKKFGFGGYLVNNRTGIGNFNTTTFMLSGAYDILAKKDNTQHVLTTGLQMGLFYRATNPNSLNYDVQYITTGDFDKGIANNEAYNNRVSMTRFDANFGLFYKFTDRNKKAHPFAGFSMSHVSMPDQSFMGGKDRLPIKFMFNGGCDIKIDDKMDVTPRLLYMNQAKASEIMAGFLFYYKITENNTRVYAGFDYRYKDACIASLGLKHDSYQFRVSYDFNTSYLKNYSNGRGAFEISLICIGEKGKPFFKSVSSF